MSQSNYTEIGRFAASSAAAAGPSSGAQTVDVTIVNSGQFTARVAFLAHRHHELNEHRVVVLPGQTVHHYCLKGEVVIVLFNVDDNSFVWGSAGNIVGPFTLPIP